MQHHPIRFLLSALLVFVACSSNVNLGGVTGNVSNQSTHDFDVTIVQASTPQVFRGQTTADVRFDISVANRTAESYAVKRITIQTMGGSDYSVPPTTRNYDRVIAPGTTETFEYWATTTLGENVGPTPRAPLTVRTTIEAANADGAKREETFTARLNGRVSVVAGKN